MQSAVERWASGHTINVKKYPLSLAEYESIQEGVIATIALVVIKRGTSRYSAQIVLVKEPKRTNRLRVDFDF